MGILGTSIPFSIVDERIRLAGVDITDSVERLAFELGEDGSWLSFQVRAEIADEGITDLPFNPNTVAQFLGGPGLETSPGEIEQIIVGAMGYGSEPDACGRAVFEWLRERGVVAGQ